MTKNSWALQLYIVLFPLFKAIKNGMAIFFSELSPLTLSCFLHSPPHVSICLKRYCFFFSFLTLLWEKHLEEKKISLLAKKLNKEIQGFKRLA